MTNGLVNLKKIEKMACLALKNGLRLHTDSIVLFNNKRFPSAYFLSTLAIEEIGKFFLLEDFWWHSKIDGRMEKKWEEKFIGLIYLHRAKQINFAYNLDGPLPQNKFAKQLFNGNLEKTKQNAVYVGFSRYRGKINLKGKINNPFNITKFKVEKQIMDLNDRIIEFTLGVTKSVYSVETECGQKILNKRLFIRLRKEWPKISPMVKRKLNKLENI